MSGFNFNFQVESFGLGLGAGWATAYALYRARNAITSARDSMQTGARRAQEFATRSADARYLNDLLKYIARDHLAGTRIGLKDVVVEPRFLKVAEPATPDEEKIVKDVFHVVPVIADYPYLHAPYNIETLAIEDLDNGDRALVLLGTPGSGRTTALHTIALWSLGQVDFTPSKDAVQQQLEEEERMIENEEDRARSYADRVQAEQRARDALEGDEESPQPEDVAATQGLPFRQLTPIYAHMSDIRPDLRGFAREFGRQVDPAEPLVRAVQQTVSARTAHAIPRNIYERLREGRALVLLDGFDEIPAAQQDACLLWLQAFLDEYDNNFIIVTASVRGYGPLQKSGFVPVFLRPWHDLQADALADRWAEHWGTISGQRRRSAEAVDAGTVKRLKARSRGLTPFEQTVRAWAIYQSPEQTHLQDWMQNYFRKVLAGEDQDALLPALIAAATLQLERGTINPLALDADLGYAQPGTEAEAESAAAPADPHDAEDLDSVLDSLDLDLKTESALVATSGGTEEIDNLLDSLEEPEVVDMQGQPPAEATAAGSRLSKTTASLLKTLARAGILRAVRGGDYRFTVPAAADYYASFALADLPPGDLYRKSSDPAWREAFVFSASHLALGAVVSLRLEEQPDLLYDSLLETSRWLRHARGTIDWVPALMTRLGKLFAARTQYPLLRERVAAALVGTRDRNAVRVFEKALHHPDPSTRRLCCLALGALRIEAAVPELGRMLEDSSPDVALSAGLALGAIGTDQALEEMAVALTSGSETLRQAAAEAFAAIPDEGYPVLYDAIRHEDMMLRRAAVFGLRRVNTPWALIALYRASIEDEEWYVRSAAEQVFLEMKSGETASGPRRAPEPLNAKWVRDWVASLGERARQLPKNSSAVLRHALEEGDADIQLLSVKNIGQLGYYDQAGMLYTALRHRDPFVRDAAYRALASFQEQVNTALPAPA